MTEFLTRPSPRIACGEGMLMRLPEFVEELGCSRPLIVTDAGVTAAGHVMRALQQLEKSGFAGVVYDQSQENPTSTSIENCCKFAQEEGIDCLIGLGGGSSLDTAKGCNFLLSNGGEMKDYHGYGKALEPMLPFIAIPTTAGTGSECQSYALVSDDVTHEKMACGDPQALASVAILDPELTASQPRTVAILTGLDALAHALETAVSTRCNPLSRIYSREAFLLLSSAIPGVLAGEPNLEQRSAMQLGAAWAGLAIENSMLGGAHASANPLTASWGVPHGHAVAAMLPAVMRFNAEDEAAEAIYRDLAKGIKLSAPGGASLALWWEDLVKESSIGAVTTFRNEAVSLDELSEAATRQWTGQFNPRPLQKKDFFGLYESVLFDE